MLSDVAVASSGTTVPLPALEFKDNSEQFREIDGAESLGGPAYSTLAPSPFWIRGT